MKINCLRNDGLIKYKSLLGLFRADYVKKPRCSFGYTYVFCLVDTKNTSANLVRFINPSFLITFLLCLSVTLSAQNISSQDPAYAENVQAGEAALKATEYNTCLDFYAKAFTIKQTSYLSIMRAAACAYSAKDKAMLKKYLNKAFEISWDGSKNIVDSYEEFDYLRGTKFQKTVNKRYQKALKSSGLDLALMEEFKEIQRTDQEQRRHMGTIASKHGWQSPQMDSLWSLQNTADKANTKRISEIIDKSGYPGKSAVGDTYAGTAFMVIQHAGIEVQEKYLEIVKAAADAGEVRWASVALLIDRVNLRRGGKQIYGSQVYRDQETNEHYFGPIEEPYKVDSLRAKVGLGTLQEYGDNWQIKWNPDKHIARHKKEKKD